MTSAKLAFAAGLLLAAAGCQAPGVARQEIPADPIAFIFHPEAEARRRAEAQAKRKPAPARSALESTSIVDLNTFGDYLAAAFGSRSDDEFPGRLAFLSPASGQVTILEAARPGAIPLAWSPARDRLLFAQWDLGSLQLFEFGRDARVVSQLTSGPDHHPQGCYGPNGQLVAVVAKRPDGAAARGVRGPLVSQIAALGPGDRVELLSPGPTDGEPACSPDGSAVAYVRILPDAPSEIWIRDLRTDDPGRAIARGREPAFSPDGSWIVYSRVAGKKSSLWRIRRDGTGRTRIGRGSGADEYDPALSPDGSLVVYESVLDNRYRLFVRRFDGTGDRVLFSDGDGTHAVW
jgi:hypothetical protein